MAPLLATSPSVHPGHGEQRQHPLNFDGPPRGGQVERAQLGHGWAIWVSTKGGSQIAGWFISWNIPSFEMDHMTGGSPMTQETTI